MGILLLTSDYSLNWNVEMLPLHCANDERSGFEHRSDVDVKARVPDTPEEVWAVPPMMVAG